jgi:hypothetical protein
MVIVLRHSHHSQQQQIRDGGSIASELVIESPGVPLALLLKP